MLNRGLHSQNHTYRQQSQSVYALTLRTLSMLLWTGKSRRTHTHTHGRPVGVGVRQDHLVTAIHCAVFADIYLDRRKHERD